MKVENQVCSLELAKKLKELGVKQESLFYWEMHQVNDSYGVKYELRQGTISGAYDLISAFTVAELGEMLPVGMWCLKKSDCWEAGSDYVNHCNWLKGLSKKLVYEEAITEADARAKMLIYLLENKLI